MSRYHSRSITRRTILAAISALLVASLIPSTPAGASASKLTNVRLNRSMALPGVTLAPGAYTFEILNPSTSGDAVVVRSVGGRAHFLGFTRGIARPRDLRADQVIVIGEAPAGEPIPITAWYPVGYGSGHQFIY